MGVLWVEKGVIAGGVVCGVVFPLVLVIDSRLLIFMCVWEHLVFFCYAFHGTAAPVG